MPNVVGGMQFDRGYLSPHFITNVGKQDIELDDPYILLYEQKLSSEKPLLPVLEAVAKTGKPLLIVAEDVEGETLSLLVANKLRGILEVAAVKAPGFGNRRMDMLEDIAIVTGARELGIKLESVTLPMLGRAKHIRIDRDTTTIIHGAGSKKDIDARITHIKEQIKRTTSAYDREKLQEREAKLVSAVSHHN